MTTTRTERMAAQQEATNAANRLIQQLRQARNTLLSGPAQITAIQNQYAPIKADIDAAAADENASVLDLNLKAASDALTAEGEAFKTALQQAESALQSITI